MNLLQNSPIARHLEVQGLVAYDVGARGALDQELAASAWATTMIGFEPEPKEAERLSAQHGLPWRSVRIVPVALGGKTGMSELHVAPSPVAASLLRHNPEMIEMFGHGSLHRTVDKIPVSTITLDEVVEMFNLPLPDFLKLDIEGAELDVLQSGSQALQYCVALKIECSFVEQRIHQPLAHEVIAYLLGHDFQLFEIRDVHMWRRRPLQSHPLLIRHPVPYSRGQLAQADLLFLKGVDRLADGASALRAILVAAVLGYVDYGVHILRKHKTSLADIVDLVDLEQSLTSASEILGRAAVRSSIAAKSAELLRTVRSALNMTRADKTSLPY